jgi:metal-responsive CopG/Arc/MetJ family transcriptional regulator
MASTTIAVELTNDVLDRLDSHCRSAHATRDDVIRDALAAHLESGGQAETDRRIVEGYRRKPAAGGPATEAAARALITEEPW